MPTPSLRVAVCSLSGLDGRRPLSVVLFPIAWTALGRRLRVAAYAVAMRFLSLAFLAAALLAACTGAETGSDEDSPSVGSTTTTSGLESITVWVEFSSVGGVLFGPASGTVLGDNGEEVATFEFGSGWEIPDNWGWRGTLAQTETLTSLEIELPSPGRYTFILDEFAVSNSPCGTCERGLSGGRVQLDVRNNDVVELPAGDLAWES